MPFRSRARMRPPAKRGGGSFTPATLSPVLWFEADTGVTAPANAVQTWTNLGSLSTAATQATGANQPTYNATGGPGGTKPAIVFADPRYLLVPHSAAYKTAQLTWWAVIKYDSIIAFQTAMNTSSLVSWGDGYGVTKVNGTVGNTDASVWTTGYLANNVTFATLGTTNWHIVIGRYNGSQVLGRRNGVAGTPASFAGPIAHGAYPMSLGGAIGAVSPDAYGYNLSGRMISAGMIGRSITDGECAQLEAFLSIKWGFALV